MTRFREFLTAALQENEIPMHIETPDGQTHIYVSARERRAGARDRSRDHARPTTEIKISTEPASF